MADYDISKITLDSGDVCNLKDSNLRGATVSVIEGDTASKAYNIGDVLVKGSNAYIVKQAIAAGDTLTAGTNITNVYTLANLERRLMSDFAPIQEGDTATIKRSVGDYLIMHGTLYKVTAAIAVGDTLTVGTNITATNLGTQLVSEVSRAKSAESTNATNITTLSNSLTSSHTVSSKRFQTTYQYASTVYNSSSDNTQVWQMGKLVIVNYKGTTSAGVSSGGKMFANLPAPKSWFLFTVVDNNSGTPYRLALGTDGYIYLPSGSIPSGADLYGQAVYVTA